MGNEGPTSPLLHLGSPRARGARELQHGARVSQKGVERGADALSQGAEVVATLGEGVHMREGRKEPVVTREE